MKSIKILMLHIRRFFIKRKLHKNINSGKLILVSDKHRGIGKSTMIMELAKKYDTPIICGCKAQSLWRENKGVKSYSSQNIDLLRQSRFPNGVFIEEGVPMEKIIELRNIGIHVRTGFYYNSILL